MKPNKHLEHFNSKEQKLDEEHKQFLKVQINDVRREVQQVQKKREEEELRLHPLQIELQRLQSEADSKNLRLQKLREELEVRMLKVESKEQKLDSKLIDAKEMSKEWMNLRDELNRRRLNDFLLKVREQNLQLEEEFDQKQKKKLDKESREQRQIIGLKQRLIEGMRRERDDKMDQLDIMRQQFLSWSMSMQSLSSLLWSSEESLQRSQTDMRRLTANFDTAIVALAKRDAAINDLELVANEQDLNLRKTRNEQNLLEDAIKSEQSKHLQYSNLIKAKEGLIGQLSEKIDKIQGKMVENKGKGEKLESQIGATRNSLALIKSDYEYEQLETKKLSSRLKTIEEDVMSVERETFEIMSFSKQTQNCVEKWRKKLKKLQEKSAVLEMQVVKVEEIIIKLEIRKDTLKNQMSSLSSEESSRNFQVDRLRKEIEVTLKNRVKEKLDKIETLQSKIAILIENKHELEIKSSDEESKHPLERSVNKRREEIKIIEQYIEERKCNWLNNEQEIMKETEMKIHLESKFLELTRKTRIMSQRKIEISTEKETLLAEIKSIQRNIHYKEHELKVINTKLMESRQRTKEVMNTNELLKDKNALIIKQYEMEMKAMDKEKEDVKSQIGVMSNKEVYMKSQVENWQQRLKECKQTSRIIRESRNMDLNSLKNEIHVLQTRLTEVRRLISLTLTKLERESNRKSTLLVKKSNLLLLKRQKKSLRNTTILMISKRMEELRNNLRKMSNAEVRFKSLLSIREGELIRLKKKFEESLIRNSGLEQNLKRMQNSLLESRLTKEKLLSQLIEMQSKHKFLMRAKENHYKFFRHDAKIREEFAKIVFAQNSSLAKYLDNFAKNDDHFDFRIMASALRAADV